MYKDACTFFVLPFLNLAEATMSQARTGRSSEKRAEFVTAHLRSCRDSAYVTHVICS